MDITVACHKDADGICSASLWQILHEDDHLGCFSPAEFGNMLSGTLAMFDMKPLGDPIQMGASPRFECWDHHPVINYPYSKPTWLHQFDVPTSAGILGVLWDDIPRDLKWVGCVGSAGDEFENWHTVMKDRIHDLYLLYPELRIGKTFYARSKIELDLASYCATLVNTEYRTDFFRECISSGGFWQPSDSIAGLTNSGDPLSFLYSKWGDKLYERKSAVNNAAEYAVSGEISNVTGYKPEEDEIGHTVEGRHTLILGDFAVVIFKSNLDIGSLVATKMYDRVQRTVIALNRFDVCGLMHCSMRGPDVQLVLSALAEKGFHGGGHEEAAGVLIHHDEQSFNRFLDTLRYLKSTSYMRPITKPRRVEISYQPSAGDRPNDKAE